MIPTYNHAYDLPSAGASTDSRVVQGRLPPPRPAQRPRCRLRRGSSDRQVIREISVVQPAEREQHWFQADGSPPLPGWFTSPPCRETGSVAKGKGHRVAAMEQLGNACPLAEWV